jgi:DNA polymerase III delta prime subunit
MTNYNNLLWCEKYRPKTIAETILPSHLKKLFGDIVASGEMPNLLLHGGAGCGKTTVAKALCEEMGLDYLFLNASENGNIDTLRTKLRDYASSVSLRGKHKVVILDEADYLNAQSTQPALRGFIEEFSANCRFILTCNFKNRVIEPLHSRCSVVEFTIPKAEEKAVFSAAFERICQILKNEKVTFDKKTLVNFVFRYYPDFRKLINELQSYAKTGTIDVGILSTTMRGMGTEALVAAIKSKDYGEVRKWIGENSDIDQIAVIRSLYDQLSTLIEDRSIPPVVVLLGEYLYRMSLVADREICLAACCAELMINAEFR